jgi:hypothetical protein
MISQQEGNLKKWQQKVLKTKNEQHIKKNTCWFRQKMNLKIIFKK